MLSSRPPNLEFAPSPPSRDSQPRGARGCSRKAAPRPARADAEGQTGTASFALRLKPRDVSGRVSGKRRCGLTNEALRAPRRAAQPSALTPRDALRLSV